MARRDDQLTTDDLESVVHALGDIFDLVNFIIHENTGMTEEKETEFRDVLLRAGRTITEHVRARF